MNKKKFSIVLVVITFVLIIVWVLYSLNEFNNDKNDYAPTDSDASEPEWVDERFGVAGSSSVINRMGIKYRVGWGNDFKGNTIDNLFKQGREQVIYIGRMEHAPNDDLCADRTVHYNAEGDPSCGGFKYIQELAEKYPGKYWVIGNEPDFNPYMKPRDYAIWYHKFYEKIKQHDPTAHVSVGGNFLTMYAASRESWAEFGPEYLEGNPLFVAQINAINNSGESSAVKAERIKMLRENAWLVLFREYHKSEFGEYPELDYWNIHNYPNRFYKGILSDPIADSKAQLDSVLKYISYIGDEKKPVWVTEFSVFDTQNCFSFEDCNNKAELNMDFMDQMIDYYINNTNKRVTKWFWYTADNSVSNACAIKYLDSTPQSINLIGANYLSLATSFRDNSVPVISELSIVSAETDDTKTVFQANASDEGNAGIAEFCYSVKSSVFNLPDIWKCIPWVGSSYKFSFGKSQYNYKNILKVKVKDSSGNFSVPVQISFPLDCPKNIAFNCTDGKAIFTWDPLDGVTKYMIRINREPDSDWANTLEGDIADQNVTSTRYEVDLQANKNYVWWSVQGIRYGENYPYSGCQSKKTEQFSCNPVDGGCTPSCGGRQCGDDTCGGSCGTCAGNQTCNEVGQCIANTGGCTPSCEGKQCGNDGCGGSCGTCIGDKTCNASGQCVDSQAAIDIDIDGIEGVSIGDYSVFVKDYLAYRRNNTYNERSDFVKSTPNVINMADYQAFVLEYLRLRRL